MSGASPAFRMRAFMYFDELPEGSRIPKPSAQRAGVKSGEQIPTEALVSAVEDGSDIHDSLTRLAARGWTETQLRELMDRSAAKDGDTTRWSKRVGEIPRLVASAAKKAAKRVEQAFGDPVDAPRADQSSLPPTVRLPTLTPADLSRRKIVPRRWVVENVIPEGEPTLLYGAGATGKSLLLLQLCICVAAGRKWLEREVPKGRAVFFTCEDSTDELTRRATSILEGLGATWEECGDRLLLVPMRDSDHDATLASESLEATPTYNALKELVDAFKPDIRVIDTLADVFAGDENRRSDAKRFVKLITRLGPGTDIVTAHPSVSGIADGRGASGSTGWPAAVRSHLFFDRVRETDGREVDTDARRLRNLKANYSRQGAGEIDVRWVDGAFVAVDGGRQAEFGVADIDEVFVSLLRTYAARGRFVNSSGGTTYAPAVFVAEQEAKAHRLSKRDLRDAMNRLFAAGRITNATRMVDRKERTYLAVVEGEPTAAPWLG